MNKNLSEINKATRFSSTRQPKNPGRKKSRFRKMKDNGMSNEDINICIKIALDATIAERRIFITGGIPEKYKKHFVKDEVPGPLVDLCIGLLGGNKGKNITALMQMVARAFGNPIQKIEAEIIQVPLTIEEKKERVKYLLNKHPDLLTDK